jgi:hypothetical protein
VYFIPRNNKIYSFFVTIPQHSWYALTGSFMTLALVAWIVLLYLPMERHYVQLQAEYKDLLDQQLRVQKLQQEKRERGQSIAHLKDTVSGTISFAQTYKTTAPALLTKAVESGLGLVSWLSKSTQILSWHTHHVIECEFQGSFDQIVCFFSMMAFHNSVVQLDHITIRKDHDLLTFMGTIAIIEVNAHAFEE